MNCTYSYKNKKFSEEELTEQSEKLFVKLQSARSAHAERTANALEAKRVRMIPVLESLKARSGINYKFVSLDEASKLIDTTDFRTSFILNDTVHFIEETFNEEEPLHEYGHIFVKVLQKTDPNYYNSLIQELFEDERALRHLDYSRSVNKHYNEEEHQQEALVKMIGLQGASLINMNLIRKIITKLQEFFFNYLGFPVNFDTKLKFLVDKMLKGTTTLMINGIPIKVETLLFNTVVDPVFEKIKKEAKSIQLIDEQHYQIVGEPTLYKRLTDVITLTFKNKTIYSANLQEEADKRADELWAGKDPLELIEVFGVSMDGKKATLNKENYKKEFLKYRSIGIQKGNLFHAKFDQFLKRMANKTTEAQALISVIARLQSSSVYAYAWFTDTLFTTIARNAGLILPNLNKKSFLNLPAFVDQIESELKILSKIMGFGSTIDLLVRHFDNRYSIFDWKTTVKLNLELAGSIMNNSYIPNTPRNRAKMEILLRAIALKVEHPSMQFRRLSVIHIPNATAGFTKDFYSDVDVSLYLPIVETYYKNNFPEIYAKMKANSKSVFVVSEYMSVSQTTAIKMAQSNLNNSDYLEFLKNEIAKKNAERNYFLRTGMTNSSEDDQATVEAKHSLEIRRLTKQILELESISNMTPVGINAEDISWYKGMFGQYTDLDSSEAQIIKKMMSEAKSKIDAEYQQIKIKLNEHAIKILKEYYDDQTVRNILNTATRGMVNFLNYGELFSPLIKLNKDGYEMMITKDDSEWADLSEAQKGFLTFLQDNYQKLGGELLNKKINVTEYTQNSYKEILFSPSQSDYSSIFEKTGALARGFFAKIPITEHEFLNKNKALSEEHRARMWFQIKDAFLVSPKNEEIDLGLPLKYISTFSPNHSQNLAMGFEAFMKMGLEKKYYDPVYATALGFVDVLKHRTVTNNSGTKPIQENLVNFLENKILMDFKKETREEKWSTHLNGLDVKKIESHWRRLTSIVIMAVKPVQGVISGGIVPFAIGFKRGLSNLVAKKIFGVKKIDNDAGDWAIATAVWLDLEKDKMIGNLHKNKTWLLLKKTNFLPDDFAYTLNEDDSTVVRNLAFSSKYNYIFHTFWENANATITLIAQLKAMKLADGTSVYDNYEVETKTENGITYSELAWNGEVRGIERINNKEVEVKELTYKEIMHLKRTYERMQGPYRVEEKVSAEAYLLGRIGIQFRKYLTTMLTQAFQSKHKDLSGGGYEVIGKTADGKDILEWQAATVEGTYRVLGRLIKDILSLKGKNAIENLTDEEKIELADALITISILILSFFFGGSMFGDDDEDDQAKKVFYRIAENMSQRYNFIDWGRTIKQSPATLAKAWDTTGGYLTLFLYTPYLGLVGQEMYTQDGNLKGLVNTLKGTPYLASAYATLQFFENNSLTGDKSWFEDYLKSFDLR